MAKKRFLVVEDSFIGMQLIRAEEKKIVEIETDIDKGGMTPGANLLEVDEADEPTVAAAKGSKPKRAAAAGDANDLA